MIRHLFKLMWNQKRKNLGLLVEIFVSFLVIFAVFTFLVYNFKRYQEPLGFEHDRIWAISFYSNNGDYADADDYNEGVQLQVEKVDQHLKNYPEFESYSFCSANHPFTGNMHSTELSYEGKSASTHIYWTDERYAELFKIPLVAGRWFNRSEMGNEVIPVVINRLLQEELYGDEDMIGKQVPGTSEGVTFQIVGLIDNFKQWGEFSSRVPRFFQPISKSPPNSLLIRVEPGTDASVEARLFEDIQQITKDWTVEIRYMDDLRRNILLETWIPATIFLIIATFLIFNVALGLFGVVWQNINKRKQEIGVRRAMGATKNSIRGQIIGEIAVLATLSMLLGSFFAIQFPLLNVFNLPTDVYIMAIILTISFIYLIVLICSSYPSQLAAQLHPAVALHEE